MTIAEDGNHEDGMSSKEDDSTKIERTSQEKLEVARVLEEWRLERVLV